MEEDTYHQSLASTYMHSFADTQKYGLLALFNHFEARFSRLYHVLFGQQWKII